MGNAGKYGQQRATFGQIILWPEPILPNNSARSSGTVVRATTGKWKEKNCSKSFCRNTDNDCLPKRGVPILSSICPNTLRCPVFACAIYLFAIMIPFGIYYLPNLPFALILQTLFLFLTFAPVPVLFVTLTLPVTLPIL